MISMTTSWRKTALLFLLLLGGIPVLLFAQDETLITAIQINGLKRTNPRVAEEPLRRFIGQEAAALDPDQVKAAVIDQGILEPTSVAVEDNSEGSGKILLVEVREKWAIFPVPVFFAGSSGVSGGLAFFDANAFGMNHKMGAVGMYLNAGGLAMLLYSAAPRGPGYFGWNANIFFSQGEQKHTDPQNEPLRRFTDRSIEVRTGLQYQISRVLNAGFRLAYMHIAILDNDDPKEEPDSGAQFLRLGPELALRTTHWDGYLLSEESASFTYRLIQDLEGPSWHSLSFRGVYEKSLIPGFRVSGAAGWLYRPEAPPLLESGPSEAGVNILPSSFSARHYAGLSLGLEKYLFRFSFGTISLLSAWQMVYSQGPLLGDRFDYGVMGSLRLYMSRLAIPAMGFGVAYNIPADYFQFAFSIGMTL